MSARTRNTLVGTMVLVALLALGWMILQFSSNTISSVFAKGTPFKVRVDRSDGISPGSAVSYLGVVVGQVTDVRRLPDNTGVMIEARLDNKEAVPANVTGTIKSTSALSQNATLALDTGGPPAGRPLAPGQEVPAVNRNQGLVPPELNDLLRQARDRELIAHVDEAVVEVRAQVRRAGEMIGSVNQLVGDPKVRADLTASVASIRATADNLEKFSVKVDAVAGETTETLRQVRVTLVDTNKRVDDLSKQVGDRLTRIGELTDKFNAIATKVNKGEGTLGALVNDGRLYEGLLDTSKALNLTIADLRRLVEQWEQEGVALKLK